MCTLLDGFEIYGIARELVPFVLPPKADIFIEAAYRDFVNAFENI